MLKSRRTKPFHILGLLVLVVLAVAAVIAVILSRQTPQDYSWQRVRAEGRLRVGLDPSYPPFEFLDEATNELQGYDVELALELGRRLGVQVDFVYIGFDSLYDAVMTNKIDAIISGMPYDPNWTEDVAYGMWYFNAGQFLVVRQNETQINSVADLASRRLGVELGTTGDLEARRLQRQIAGLAVVTFPTSDDVLHALQDNQLDAALIDAISAYLFISKGGKVKLLHPAISDESYAVVTNRKSVQLRSAIDAILLQMKEDGFLEKLRDRWLLGQSS